MNHRNLIDSLLLAALCFAGASGMDGKVATVITLAVNGGEQPANRSRLVVVPVGNNNASSGDTLAIGPWMRYPTWSFDGTRIGFYMSGSGVCVADIRTRTVKVVAQVIDWTRNDHDVFMAWPGADGGNWLYYHRACNGCMGNGSGEIWKVNVEDTAQKVLVTDYRQDNANGYFMRFSLSADARYAVIHTNDLGNLSYLGYKGGIIPHTFPPRGSPDSPDPWATKPQCLDEPSGWCGMGDCNSALSPSGKVMYHFSGAHTALYAASWNHDAETMTGFFLADDGWWGSIEMGKHVEAWLGTGHFADCFIYPRGSSNSDQIVVMCAGYGYGAAYECQGNNIVVVNWGDRGAVKATNNPDLRDDIFVPNGTIWKYCEPSDFWLETPAGKGGCYEDIDGAWIGVEGAVGSINPGLSPARGSQRLTGGGLVSVYDLKGARIGSSGSSILEQSIAHGSGFRPCVVVGRGAAGSAHLRVLSNGIAARYTRSGSTINESTGSAR